MRMRWFAAAVIVILAAACAEPPLAADSTASPTSAGAAANPDCGFEGQRACPVLDAGPRCDHGLKVDGRRTPLPGDDLCVNDTRHLVGAQFRGTWADWALANQRTLAIDEPINWVQLLSTHNAFNNVSDALGFLDANERLDPNQVWSLSDQLDLGSRMLWLDLHWTFGAVHLCHPLHFGGPDVPNDPDPDPERHIGCFRRDRKFAYAVREIADWMTANPNEIVIMDLEAYVEQHFDDVAGPLEAYLGSWLYRTADRTNGSAPWPSTRELLAGGKRVIVGALGGGVDPVYYVGDNFRGTTHDLYIDGALQPRFIKHVQFERTDGIVTSCTTVGEQGRQTLLTPNHQFRVIGEDRTTYSLTRPPDHKHHVGVIRPADAANLASCGIYGVSLDMLSASRGDVGRGIPDEWHNPDRIPDEERQPYLVWSWRSGDLGGAGDAALLRGSDGRWASSAPSARHRFACGRPRSETSRDIADWTDTLAIEWRVTTRDGAWHEGGRACLDEFGGEGFVFSVPVHGLANGRLRLADAARGEVWLNYNDIKQEGAWVINQRPHALAGADRTVECNGHGGTPVQLDGRSSSDPEGDQLEYEWSGVFGTATGAQPIVLLPLGRHTIRLIVDDGFGGVNTDEVVIEVVDTTPPEIRSATAAPNPLWPPNHKMVPVVVTVDVHDACDAAPVCRIVSVASSEPGNDVGDGNTTPDWEITGALTLNLRAERAGPGDGRVYTITIECADESGNVSTSAVLVRVNHDGGVRSGSSAVPPS